MVHDTFWFKVLASVGALSSANARPASNGRAVVQARREVLNRPGNPGGSLV